MSYNIDIDNYTKKIQRLYKELIEDINDAQEGYVTQSSVKELRDRLSEMRFITDENLDIKISDIELRLQCNPTCMEEVPDFCKIIDVPRFDGTSLVYHFIEKFERKTKYIFPCYKKEFLKCSITGEARIELSSILNIRKLTYENLKEYILSTFGNIFNILDYITIEHRIIGKLPPLTINSDWNLIYEMLEKHVKLLEQSESINKHVPLRCRFIYYSDYLKMIRSFLPKESKRVTTSNFISVKKEFITLRRVAEILKKKT